MKFILAFIEIGRDLCEWSLINMKKIEVTKFNFLAKHSTILVQESEELSIESNLLKQ